VKFNAHAEDSTSNLLGLRAILEGRWKINLAPLTMASAPVEGRFYARAK
jgi:hypothetical protein